MLMFWVVVVVVVKQVEKRLEGRKKGWTTVDVLIQRGGKFLGVELI